MDHQATWTGVVSYFTAQLHGPDPSLDLILSRSHAAGLPAHEVAPNQGKLLYLLAKLSGARRVLEIGTLGGYSTAWFARAVPSRAPGGCMVSLEVDAERASLAVESLRCAGVSDVVEVRVGPALEALKGMFEAGDPPFDFVFIDADKENNAGYLEFTMKLAKVGTVAFADNVVRDGGVVDAGSLDRRVQGVRRFTEILAADRRLEAMALQTVGTKGYDGFVLARVVSL